MADGGGNEALRNVLAEVSDLGRARALLAWDERTQMPPRGAPMRAEQIATLTALRHRRLASDELGRLLDAAAGAVDGADREGFEASLVRVARRDWDKARRVPTELRAEIARATSIAEHAWEAAREASDFAAFLPELEGVVELKRRYIECFEYDHPYDALLDDFEPGMKTAALRPVLERLRDGVVPLLEAIVAGGVELDPSPLYGDFPEAEQERLAAEVAASLPLEPDAWRLDSTVHPFAVGIAISDLRITTRFDPDYVGTALWAVIHEVGHALYENGLDPALERTPLCRSVSLGFDESQSRLWENWVGRGRPFMNRLLPLLREPLPRALRRPRARGPLPGRERGRPVADPGRGRRGHLQPAHRPALRARAADLRRARSRSPTCPRPGTRACPSTSGSRCRATPTACSRTCTGRAAPSATSPPTRSAT